MSTSRNVRKLFSFFSMVNFMLSHWLFKCFVKSIIFSSPYGQLLYILSTYLSHHFGLRGKESIAFFSRYSIIVVSTSRNGRQLFSSFSMVNFMLLHWLFRCFVNSVIFSSPCGQLLHISSTYLSHHFGLRGKESISFFSRYSTIVVSTSTYYIGYNYLANRILNVLFRL